MGREASQQWQSRALVVGALVVAAVLVFVLAPTDGGGDAPDAPGAEVAATTPSSTEAVAPPTATDEEFCAGFRVVAERQGLFVGTEDETSRRALEEAADDLVVGGVPAGMSLPARSGYFTLLNGIYGSIGRNLAPAAVGAPEDAAPDGDAAFSAYLAEYCPA